MTLALITVAALLSGCLMDPGAEHEHTILYSSPFQELIDSTTTLKRPVRIVSQSGNPPSGDEAVFLDLGLPKKINVMPPAVLPSGTEIRFDSFDCSRDFAFTLWPFFLDLPPTHTEFEAWFTVPSLKLPPSTFFIYRWGKGSYLYRAPWQNATDPERTYIGGGPQR